MKRVILSATKQQIANNLVLKFTAAGCTNVVPLEKTDTYCRLKMTLPNGRSTTITAWYNHNLIRNGRVTKVIRIPWQPNYTVNNQGDVFDNGQLVGRAVVETQGKTYQRTRKNYLLRSIRTDSGDVIIDHPQIANNYSQVVNTLQSRTVTWRS